MRKFLLILSILIIFGNALGQPKVIGGGGIVNGKATYLPIPEYPQEAKDLCAGGQVAVRVLIDENGNVIEAEAVAGDEILWDYAVEAAKKAKFGPFAEGVSTKKSGTIIYNFVPERICVDAGVVNKKAKNLPKLVLNSDLKINESTLVKVRIIIDESGKVILAKAFSGNPIFYLFAEDAARKAEFNPTNDVGKIRIKGSLFYKINTDRTIDTEFPKPIVDIAGGTVIGIAKKLVNPKIPFCNCKFGDYKTVVQFTVDEDGTVESATSISGHSLLRSEAEKAILGSKFSPTISSGRPIKAYGTIIYDFSKSKKKRIVNYELKVKK